MEIKNIETHLNECKNKEKNPIFKGVAPYKYLCENQIITPGSKIILYESLDHDQGNKGEWYNVCNNYDLEIMTTGEPLRKYEKLLLENITPGGWMPLLGYDENEPKF